MKVEMARYHTSPRVLGGGGGVGFRGVEGGSGFRGHAGGSAENGAPGEGGLGVKNFGTNIK